MTKPCSPRWRDELADHVLGLPAGDALRTHLASCAACSEALRQWKARISQVDAGIQDLADSDPPARLVSRIMEEVRARPRLVRLPRWNLRTAAAGGAVFILASTLWIWKAYEQRKETQQLFSIASEIGSWKSPTESLLRSPFDSGPMAPPRLGKYFYPLRTNVPQKEGERP